MSWYAMMASILRMISEPDLQSFRLVMTAVFAVLAVRGDVTASQFLTIFTVVIGFYFGTQHERAGKKEDEK